MLKDELCGIISNSDIGGGYRFLLLDAPQLASQLQPGQFIHVRVPGLEPSALRRPFSVFDAKDGVVTVLFKVVGRGTKVLAQAGAGEKVSVLGPLGHGFPLSGVGAPLLVGGGFGVAPLHFLARRLGERKGILFIGILYSIKEV